MAINLDPKIVRKSKDGLSDTSNSYSKPDRPHSAQEDASRFAKTANHDPARSAFATESAFRARAGRSRGRTR